MNVLLHVLNVILLFLFLNCATKRFWSSIAVSALFAVHPINVESVAWVAERKNILCTVFFLWALIAYVGYARRPSFGRYAFVAGLFALGLMAKPMVITLPFVLLLLDGWPLERVQIAPTANRKTDPALPKLEEIPKKRFGWLVLEKVPLLLLVMGSAAITLVAQSKGGAVSSVEQVSLTSRVGNAAVSYARYLSKSIVPVDLAALYPYPIKGYSSATILISVFLLAGITAIALLAREKPYLRTGWLWFLGTLVPVIGLVQVGNQAMADRYAYIPFIGLFIMAVWVVADLTEQYRVGRTYVAVMAFCILTALSFTTEKQMGYWRNSVALWSHAVAVTNNNFVAEDNLGNALILDGKQEEALLHFETALRIKPTDPVGILNVGIYEQKHGKLKESADLFQAVLQYTKSAELRLQAYADLGSSYRMLGDYEQARENYESALHLDPDATLAIVGLGLVQQKTGNLDEAIKNYSRALQIQPTDVGYLLLAEAWRQKGHPDQSEAAFRRAEELSHDIKAARHAAGQLISE